MSLQIAPGSTSVSLAIRVVDDSGLAVEGLVAATFPTLSYNKVGFASTNIAMMGDLAALNSAYSSGKIKEIGDGLYRFDFPNSMFSGVATVELLGDEAGKHVIFPTIKVKYADIDVSAFEDVDITVHAPVVGNTITIYVNADYTIALGRQVRITLPAGSAPNVDDADALYLGVTTTIGNEPGFTHLESSAQVGSASGAQTIDFEPGHSTETSELDPTREYSGTVVGDFGGDYVPLWDGHVIVRYNRVTVPSP